MKVKTAVLLVVAIVFLIAAAGYATSSYYAYRYPAEITHTLYLEVMDRSSEQVLQEMEATGEKQVYVFFKDQNAIPFYFLGRGEKRTRGLMINSVYEFPVRIHAQLTGDLAPFVSLSDKDFKLDPGKSKNLSITISVPEGASPGNYTAYLDVLYERLKKE